MAKYSHICELCGKEFESCSPRARWCSDSHKMTCEICKSEFIAPRHSYGKEVVTCSSKCAKELRKRTSLDHYGVDNPLKSQEVQKKVKKTNLERYGVDNPWKSEDIKKKIKNTNIERYGSEHPFSSDIIQKKSKKTMIDRYGVEYSMQSEEVRSTWKSNLIERSGVDHPSMLSEVQEKRKKTNLERYGYEYTSQVPEIREKMISTNLERYGVSYPLQNSEILKKTRDSFEKHYGVDNPMHSDELQEKVCDTNILRYGVPWYCMTSDCKESNKRTISSLNRNFSDRLNSIGLDNELEYQIGWYSYDIKVGNILIEIDPTPTHNSYIDIFTDRFKKDSNRNVHINKTKFAEQNGYRCIHIFDWDSTEKILSILKPRKTIYARRCKLVTLSKKSCDKFLDKYHLQGTCRGQKFIYGLTFNDELIGVMTFGKPRYNKNFEYELLRLCFKPEYSVIGGSERMFKNS